MDSDPDGHRGRLQPHGPSRLAAACARARGRAFGPVRRHGRRPVAAADPEAAARSARGPPPARRSTEALKAVEETPRDAERNGRLGMLLYANEQYEAAEACFERAQALDAGRGALAVLPREGAVEPLGARVGRRLAAGRPAPAARTICRPACCSRSASSMRGRRTRAGRSTRRSCAITRRRPRRTTAWAGSSRAGASAPPRSSTSRRPARSSRVRRRALRARARVPRPRREGEGAGRARPLPEGQARLAGRPRPFSRTFSTSRPVLSRGWREASSSRRPGSSRRRPRSTRRRSPPTRSSSRPTST